jgi:hypothetical protein
MTQLYSKYIAGQVLTETIALLTNSVLSIELIVSFFKTESGEGIPE